MGCNASAPKVVRTPTEVNSARLADREKSKLLPLSNYCILQLRTVRLHLNYYVSPYRTLRHSTIIPRLYIICALPSIMCV